MEQMTPMMAAYCQTKEAYKDCILFYRLGDFYEMFFEDAEIVSRELSLTLTGKDCGLKERAPMCGVPYHAAESYLAKLVGNGHKVAICEQVEDPAQAKGLVRREVVRIVTPGTVMEDLSLEAGKNNYIVSIVRAESGFGFAAADISTGTFAATEVDGEAALSDELSAYAPKEILADASFLMSGAKGESWEKRFQAVVTATEEAFLDRKRSENILKTHFHAVSLEGLGLAEMPAAALAAGALLFYLEKTQQQALSYLSVLRVYRTEQHMVLDAFTRRNLELTETLREKQKTGSLLWVLDKTKTAMGARALREAVTKPLLSTREITGRQQAVGELKEKTLQRQQIREHLSKVYDLERLLCRFSYGTGTPRDLLSFRDSVSVLPDIRGVLSGMQAPLLRELLERTDELKDCREKITAAISEDAPLAVKDGNLLKDGYSREVDELRSLKQNSKELLADLEQKERERTGIRTLRIRYNRVFGYYLEVTNSYKDKVPQDYVRKQTLTGSERYVIPPLKELEDKILGAEDKLHALEYSLFCEVRAGIAGCLSRVKKTAEAVAVLDMLASLAEVAYRRRYVCPQVDLSGELLIKDGRHPVIEAMRGEEIFVPNDVHLDMDKRRLAVITGPNMAGKSTYMRQCALIVLMAQIGSFVPAGEARIGLVDRIFTRVGASDDLASGQSTFMVEMTEVSGILKCATARSLLILDEIGRGTGTFDGLSIAWAVIEYIADKKKLGARTLFATHYHELTELEGKIDGVKNFCIAVREDGDNIVFLRKIIRGGTDKSYGILVARLAGLEEGIIERAKEIASTLEETDMLTNDSLLFGRRRPSGRQSRKPAVHENQYSLFTAADNAGKVREEEVLKELKALDIPQMTPLQALSKLDALKNRLL